MIYGFCRSSKKWCVGHLERHAFFLNLDFLSCSPVGTAGLQQRVSLPRTEGGDVVWKV